MSKLPEDSDKALLMPDKIYFKKSYFHSNSVNQNKALKCNYESILNFFSARCWNPTQYCLC